jgi:hypothetical protein
MTYSQIRVAVDATLRLLGFTGKTMRHGTKYYCKEFPAKYGKTEKVSLHLQGVSQDIER